MKIVTLAYLLSLLAVVAACTTSEEKALTSLQDCNLIGYQPGTIEHANCAERGFRSMQAEEDAAAGAAGAMTGAILAAAIINAAF